MRESSKTTSLIDADAEAHAAGFFYASIALRHRPLDCHRALSCVRDTAELCEDPIAGGVNDAASALCDHGEYDGPMHLEVANRTGFIRTQEGAVTSDVGRKNCCQPAENLGLFRPFGHCWDPPVNGAFEHGSSRASRRDIGVLRNLARRVASSAKGEKSRC